MNKNESISLDNKCNFINGIDSIYFNCINIDKKIFQNIQLKIRDKNN